MKKIESLISVRERSTKEVRDRLSIAHFNEEEIEDAVSTALRVGLISDERFTSAFIRGKANLGWGKQKIVARLHQSGINDETISKLDHEFPSKEIEYENAYRILERKISHSKNPKNSYVRRLIAKGYSYDFAIAVVTDFLSSCKS